MSDLVERLPMEHILKVWPEYYIAIRWGQKNFEVRKNDRDFRVGDTLRLSEWCPRTGDWTRGGPDVDAVVARIKFILEGGQFGIEPGYVVMGLGPPTPDPPEAAAEIARLRTANKALVEAAGPFAKNWEIWRVIEQAGNDPEYPSISMMRASWEALSRAVEAANE